MKRYTLLIVSLIIGIIGALLKLESNFQYFYIILLIGAIGFLISIYLLIVTKK